MSTLGKAMEEANLDKDRLWQELAELEALLKRAEGLYFSGGRARYSESLGIWSAYAKNTKALYFGPSLLQALKVLVEGKAQ